MSLTTRIALERPVDVHKLWSFARSLLSAPPEVETIKSEFDNGAIQHWRNAPGSGLAALLIMEFGIDGPIPQDPEAASPGFQPAVTISFDTPYGYLASNDANVQDLHAYLAYRVLQWASRRGARGSWQDEFTGRWAPLADVALFGDVATGQAAVLGTDDPWLDPEAAVAAGPAPF